MKKLICILLLVCMMPAISAADSGLSSMSYEELISLQRLLVTEIMSRPEWKEVTVPSGAWIVGVDIPAGFYSIKGVKKSTTVTVGDERDSMVYFHSFSEGEEVGKIELKEGHTFHCSYEIILAPPVSLFF